MNKNILFISLVSFFVDFSTAMVTPMLPIFVIEYLDAGYTELGIIVAISTFVTYITRLFSGYISDRFALAKSLVVGGYMLSVVVKPLFYFIGNWGAAAVLQTMERFGKGLREAPRDKLISDFSLSGGSGSSFGLHRTLDTAGHSLGSLSVFLALLYFGQNEETIRNLFLLSALPGLIGVVIVVLFVKESQQRSVKMGKIMFLERDRRLVWPIVIYAGFTAFLFTESFFVMRAKESGFETLHIPLLFMTFTLSQTLLSYPIGLLIDRYKGERVLIFSYITGVLTTLLLLQGSSLSVILAYIGFGVYTTASLNALRSGIAETATNKAVTYGFFYTVLALAVFVSSILIGLVWDRFGTQWALLFSLGGTVLFLIGALYKMKVSPEKENA